MERGFRRSPPTAHRPVLVDTIDESGHEAYREIRARYPQREALCAGEDKQRRKETGGYQNSEGQRRGDGGYPFQPDVDRTWPLVAIKRHIIVDRFRPTWTALPWSELARVEEQAVPTVAWGDKPETFVVIPGGDRSF